MEQLWEREVISVATYLRGCDDRQVAEAVNCMRGLKVQLVETPISRGRAVQEDYNIPDMDLG